MLLIPQHHHECMRREEIRVGLSFSSYLTFTFFHFDAAQYKWKWCKEYSKTHLCLLLACFLPSYSFSFFVCQVGVCGSEAISIKFMPEIHTHTQKFQRSEKAQKISRILDFSLHLSHSISRSNVECFEGLCKITKYSSFFILHHMTWMIKHLYFYVLSVL
jgi:hypothetical protein